MNKPIRKTAASIVGVFAFAVTAHAQSPEDVPELESDQLVNEGLMDAQILAIDHDERTMTVRFETTKEMAELIVPESADIFRTRPNDLEERITLAELDPGDKVAVEAVTVEGVIHLRIVLS